MGKTLGRIELLGDIAEMADSDSVGPKLYDLDSEKLGFEEGKLANSALVRSINPLYEIIKICFFRFG